jgi:hypothetical protein
VKTLTDRIERAEVTLGHLGAVVSAHLGKLGDAAKQLERIASFRLQADHWKSLVVARDHARNSLRNLERTTGSSGMLTYGTGSVTLEVARLLGVSGYLGAEWALADRLAAMAGEVLCEYSCLKDPNKGPHLVTHFVSESRSSSAAAVLVDSVPRLYGWPIAISYAIRNHFIHHGGSVDFFEGSEPADAFKISAAGWEPIVKRAREYRVRELDGLWSHAAGDDIRDVLDTCEKAMDAALGILVGTACEVALTHAKFVTGND